MSQQIRKSQTVSQPLTIWLSGLIFACLLVSLLLVRPVSAQARTAQRKTAPASPASAQLTERAAAARTAGRFDEAVKLYQQAVRQRPAFSDGWWALGTIFYEQDRYTEGRDAFKRLLALAPQSGQAWVLLGLCEYQLKEYPGALAHIEHGLSLGFGENPNLSLVVRYHQAILYTRFEQYELAYAILGYLATQQASPSVINALGLAMLRMPLLPDETPPAQREMVYKAGLAASYIVTDRRLQAGRELAELVRLNPDAPGVHYAYGVYLLRDSPDAALPQFRRELELSPKHTAAMLQIAFIHLKSGQPAEGLPWAEQAAKLKPELFAAHYALGRLLLEAGQPDRAIAELELSAKQAPDSPETFFALARAYERTKRKEEASRARAEFARLSKLRVEKRKGQTGVVPTGEFENQ